MEARVFKPYLVLIGMMSILSLALAFTVDVRVSDQAGVRMQLPNRIGEWSGVDIRFCQNKECRKEFPANQLENIDICPACGGELSGMSYAESLQLPEDTELVRKQYRNPAGEVIMVSIVLSGKERVSIHRPQMCLVGQGRTILEEEVDPVTIQGRKQPLDVMILDLERDVRLNDGRKFKVPEYYAYWFVGKNRETPHHMQRMIWMAMDRILFNVAHRWAYISVAGSRQPGSDHYKEQVRDFVAKMYPEILLPDS
jgi:hypothetical protein